MERLIIPSRAFWEAIPTSTSEVSPSATNYTTLFTPKMYVVDELKLHVVG